ncbi:hypothetical protein A6U85_13705 [Agrobacterium sp. 13-626]|nr:hypothetical protein A6U85_13705 [Agrobacterium sp. 13-626]
MMSFPRFVLFLKPWFLEVPIRIGPMERYLMYESNMGRLKFFQIMEFGNFCTKNALHRQQSGYYARIWDTFSKNLTFSSSRLPTAHYNIVQLYKGKSAAASGNRGLKIHAT